MLDVLSFTAVLAGGIIVLSLVFTCAILMLFDAALEAITHILLRLNK